MTWNSGNPSDSEAIRNLGIVIRPNWEAIEKGDASLKYQALNLYSRDDAPGPIPSDPTAVTDTIILYSKDDADSGDPDLFTIHEDATVTQLTKGPANIAPSGFTSNGETSLYGGILLKYGVVNVSGGNSTTPVTFASIGLTNFPNNIFTVYLTPSRSGSFSASYHSDSEALTGFNIVLNGAASATTFNWLVIGN